MVAQVQLCDLVDLALCKPVVGAVNFNHLRTVLHAILKLTNHTNTLIEPTTFNFTVVADQVNTLNEPTSLGSPLEGQTNILDETTSLGDPEMNCEDADRKFSIPDNSYIPEFVEDVSNESNKYGNNINSLSIEEQNGKDGRFYKKITEYCEDRNVNEIESSINSLELKQCELESRISSLEKSVFDEFPLNEEIFQLYGKVDKQSEVSLHNINQSNRSINEDTLGNTWQAKKLKSRMDSTEEAVDKLFSLMKDVLNADKHEVPKDENTVNQLKELRDYIDELKGNMGYWKADKSLVEDAVRKIESCEENVKMISSNLDKTCNNIDKNSDNIDKNHTCLEEMEKQMRKFMGEEYKANTASNVNIDDIQATIDKKADISELRKKGNIEDLHILQDEVIFLKKDFSSVKEELSQKASNFNLDQTDTKVDSNLSQSESLLSDLKNEILGVKESIVNLDDKRLNYIIDHVGELEKLFDKEEELNNLQKKIDEITQWMQQIEVWQSNMMPMLESLHSKQLQPPPPPNLDSSVLAALQHLTQENRHHITSIQANMKLLQRLQMPVQPSTNGTDIIDAVDNQVLEQLQNHILSLQDEQVKQSGHISNMVDDYKDEFNRKQLHIDALYDYIEKLQAIKADREDITVEMNIKADKESLDSKVNMSTFDERYLMLEHTLQEALGRLNYYVEQEASLKDALNKLTTDLNSKMDSDAEKKLKKFMEERLKAIQMARNHIPNQCSRQNAAGLRKPMPILYNCLSCDRPIDVTVRGVLPPVPMNMPAKKSLSASRYERKDKHSSTKQYSSSSYNSLAMNRPCGGSHTSVNVNMLRMIKLSPLLSLPDTSIAVKHSISEDDAISVADCVMGKDGQIYRGRFRLSETPQNIFKPRDKSKHSKSRITRSATPLCKCKDGFDGDRSHSVDCLEDPAIKDKSFKLPLLPQNGNITSIDNLDRCSSVESK